MMPQGFAVAMRACSRRGRSGAPWLTVSDADCWLLVTRWGAQGEFLSIGHAGGLVARGLPAPLGLTPLASCLGLLGPVAPMPGMVPGPICFLLQPRPPPGMQLAGSFLRASGVAWLDATRRGLRLRVLGRIAGGRGSPWRAGTWRLDAVQTPWIGEVLDEV